MTGADMMRVIRQRIADEDMLNLSDAAILANINMAIRYLSLLLISRKAPEMITCEEMVDYTAVPAGFHSFVGQEPAWREGAVIRLYDPQNAVPIRFFQMAQGIAALADDLPFPDDYFDVLATAASAVCLNKDEFDTSFEQGLIEKLGAMLP